MEKKLNYTYLTNDNEMGSTNITVKICRRCKHTEIQHFQDGACFIKGCKCSKVLLS